jgi:hypothetical protein
LAAQADPGLRCFHRDRQLSFFDPGRFDLLGLGEGEGNDGRTEEEQDHRQHGTEKQERGGNPVETDTATAHRGDFMAARQQTDREQGRHQDRERRDLVRNSGHLEDEVGQHIEGMGVVPQEAAHLLEEVDDEVNRHEPGEAHAEDLHVLAQHIAKQNVHRTIGGSPDRTTEWSPG